MAMNSVEVAFGPGVGGDLKSALTSPRLRRNYNGVEFTIKRQDILKYVSLLLQAGSLIGPGVIKHASSNIRRKKC